MPEGHTIHRLANKHNGWFAGQRVEVSSNQGTFPGATEIDGKVWERAEAYGKHLFHHYDTGMAVHIHLGLFGKVFVQDAPPHPPRDTSRYRVVGTAPPPKPGRRSKQGDPDAPDAPKVIDLVGATACELVTPDEVQAIVDRLGPDPLRKDADPDKAFAALQRRSVGIGRALMDQKVLAGVGNVYRAEILFTHGLHPELPAKQVDRETWQSMWDQLVLWLRYGVRSGRIVTTTSDEIGRPPSRMKKDERVHVYKRDHCRRCGTEIRRWDLAGRWAYACESCQPPQRG